MSEDATNAASPDAAPSAPPEGTGTPPRRNPLAEFNRLDPAEKMLAGAAVAVLLGFLFVNAWGQLFSFKGQGWFHTFAFVGALGVVGVTALDLFGVKYVDAKFRPVILVGCAILPAIGFVLYSLGEFWWSLMLAGAVVMGYAAARITAREDLF